MSRAGRRRIIRTGRTVMGLDLVFSAWRMRSVFCSPAISGLNDIQVDRNHDPKSASAAVGDLDGSFAERIGPDIEADHGCRRRIR